MNQLLPPKWMMKFFRWFCREELYEAIEGDLLTIYYEKRQVTSVFAANLWYFFHTLSFFQPFALQKKKFYLFSTLSTMFFNHFKVGFRLIKRHFTYSTINIVGLAIGLSAVILISLFIKDELTYDRFHSKGEDIVRLTYKLVTPNSTRQGAKLPFPMKEVLTSSYPEVVKVARFYHWGGDTPLLEYKNQKFTEKGLYFADPAVFEMFDFHFIAGDSRTSLNDPRSIILTERLALKYFGDENPIGKVVRYKNEDNLVITGILKNLPDNSHITFDALLPIELQRQRWMGWGKYTYDLEKDWNWAGAWVYAQLTPGTDVNSFEKKTQAIAKEYLNTDDQDGFSIEVQPLFDIHLKSDKSAEARANGNLAQVYGFGAVAILILFIACVNFVNLTTSQTNERLKEVGLRKIMGAGRGHLIYQFISESFILVMLSLVLAFILVVTSLPLFNEFMNTSISIGREDLTFLISCIIIAFLIALFSGLRPTLAIIGINAAQKFQLLKTRKRFSYSMIIGQFVVCNLLLMSILIVNKQLNYLQNKDLGFNKERMVILENSQNLSGDQYAVFENEMDALTVVARIHRGYIAGTPTYTNTFKVVGDGDENTYSFGIKWIGEGFNEMFGLKVIAGRDLEASSTSDVESKILINASAAKALGWSIEESIGKKLSFLPGGAQELTEITIAGVLADANFESLYDPILPSVFRLPRSSVGGKACIKLSTDENLLTSINQIEDIWKNIIPDWPFEFSFLDKKISDQYAKEERLASAIEYFAILAILIGFSGLFGLASFTVQQRTKEIGVRKVLGASIHSLIALVSRRFLLLASVALLLSIPIGYYLSTMWLEDFAYRIAISADIFLLSGLISVLTVIMAVGSQSLKAASCDPVETLRYE